MLGQKIKRRFLNAINAVLGVMILVPGVCSAEFYVWRDADGRKVVSTIEQGAFDRDGELKARYHPNALNVQYHRMLDALDEQGKAIEMAEAHARAEAEAREMETVVAEFDKARAARGRRAPREGLMNLDELIQLEKRGGRYQ